MDYFDDLDEDTLVTVADLRDKMSEFTDTPFTTKHIKNRMSEHYGESVFFTSICGKTDLVVDCSVASEMLLGLYKTKKTAKDLHSMRKEVVRLAGMIIADDIRRSEYNPDVYFDLDELTVEDQYALLPENLQIFMNSLKSKRSKRDMRLPSSMIGQSMIHFVNRRNIPPLLTALGVEVSHLGGSGVLLEITDKVGMTCSYREVKKFQKNAALIDLIAEIPVDELSTDRKVMFPLWGADNVNVRTVTLDGGKMFDGMAIILAMIPLSKTGSIVIPRRDVFASEILNKRSKILHYPAAKDKQTINDLCPPRFVLILECTEEMCNQLPSCKCFLGITITPTFWSHETDLF